MISCWWSPGCWRHCDRAAPIQCGSGAGSAARGTRADDCRQQRHLLAFDNLSGLPACLSDALCRLATGGSFALRQLYTDDDEVLFQAARPLLVNGIEEIITRPDLADRSIFLTLPPVADARRQSERELRRQFELARPRILGALLDLVVHGLGTLPCMELDRLPRMADFALWAAACETALRPAGTFGRAYEANRRAAIEGIIDADPVAARVREIMAERNSWTGSAADLLRAGAGSGTPRDRAGWPKILTPSLAACVVPRPSYGQWAWRLRSVAKAELGAGSLGYVQFRKIPSGKR
jgi:hypothetical protein